MGNRSSFKLFIRNESDTDRVFRAVLAVISLVVTYFAGQPWFNIGMIFAFLCIFNAVSATCFIYRALGINTCPMSSKND